MSEFNRKFYLRNQYLLVPQLNVTGYEAELSRIHTKWFNMRPLKSHPK